ncbi:MAG: hypothetical protein AVDCRST_MAG26-4487 [uncultured Chloroflexia bacterium]|uniref:Uncharacterized protein n=1 Tax=uncultured Chloroflexia bacterium TaxID=1672391 RepID=A0A6J4K606_9CHLR|nr:MAG: hypothetical protein AVDCRST_MAG26-4487 [uncultured Chloroflexia bacterium]
MVAVDLHRIWAEPRKGSGSAATLAHEVQRDQRPDHAHLRDHHHAEDRKEDT